MELFDWDEANLSHIAVHGVTAAEAEQALTIAPLELDRYVIEGELRFEEIGSTRTARILKIISIHRAEKVRVITAFDASANAKRAYIRSMISQ